MDFTSIGGLALGILAIVVGRILEGGNPLMLMQFTAFLIVFGGTAGAMALSATKEDIRNIPTLVGIAFRDAVTFPVDVIPQIVKYAEKARREGLLSLEREIPNVSDPFLQQGLQLVADGTDPEVVRRILETEIDKQLDRHNKGPVMLESAGGYAPTVGIIGAVLGLISVMEHLSEGIDKVGPGIAVAFVATIYGLVLANMLCFPIASKLRARSAAEVLIKEMVLEGILSIQAGDNPRIIEEKLKSFLSRSERTVFEAQKEARR
ncbi:MAG: flagellar motor protein [Candidatus Sericytochromatia bacterium]|nr:flagellar motor protein [Candidatus Sericytochromatia bacterium]